MPVLQLSRERARQLAIMGQLLSEPRPTSILDVVRHLGGLQMDPTNTVARSELLVLWSRLGPYDTADLERLLWWDKELFEYWAFIVPTSDLAIHRETMRRKRRGSARAGYTSEWLAANDAFRRYVLARLRRRGPLRSRDFDDRSVLPWRSGGWNDSRNVGRMLELLWDRGQIMIVGRNGGQRLWDLAGRRLSVDHPRLGLPEVARRILDRQLRWRGVARPSQFGFAFDGRPPGWERALRELIREGRALPTTVEGLPGEWFAHADVIDGEFVPRTTVLSPFDKLVADRDRTEQLFDFRFRLEIYVPKDRRRYGYFVMPILYGDRLIGRVDPWFDRRANALRLHAVHAEPDAPRDAWPAVRAAIDELGSWLGAREFSVPRLPRRWR